MQRIIITAVLAASFAGAALAESPLAVPTEPFVSQKTRAEVQAELAEFKAAGVNPWSISYNPLASFRSTNTRSEVTAEYLASRDEVHAFTSEDSGAGRLRATAQTAFAARSLASN